MPLFIDNEHLTNEIETVYVGHKKVLTGVRFTSQVLEGACPLIEERLSDPRYLDQFQWNNKQAFYNDEPGGIKETTKTRGDHMVDHFFAVPEVAAGGWGAIHLGNTKEVHSSRGTWNLFDELLFPGFGAYAIPTQSVRMEKGANKKENYMKNIVVNVRPMNFYYRYKGQFFYNASKRGGFTDSLHSKFKEYIYGAILYGIENSLQNIIESGGGTERMKGVLEDAED